MAKIWAWSSLVIVAALIAGRVDEPRVQFYREFISQFARTALCLIN